MLESNILSIKTEIPNVIYTIFAITTQRYQEMITQQAPFWGHFLSLLRFHLIFTVLSDYEHEPFLQLNFLLKHLLTFNEPDFLYSAA